MNNLLDLVSISEEDEYILSGIAFLKEKELDKAIECFDTVIEKNNRSIDAYFNKALCLFILRKFDEAKDLFKKCTLIDRKFGKAYMFLGDMAFFIDGKVELALENYNKAIINNFDEEPVHLSKAFIYLTMNDSLNALKSYNKALLKNPKSKKALLGKLELYFKQLKFKDAEDCINKVREIETECEEYYTWAPLILTAQGKDKEALEILDEADKVIGFKEKVAFARIKVYEKDSKIEEALEYIDSIEEIVKANDELYYKFMNQKSNYLFKIGKNEEGKALLKMLSEDYDSEEVDFKLGNILFNEKNFEEALIYFDKITNREANGSEYFGTAVYFKAMCNDKLGNKEEAISLFKESLLYIKSACLIDPTNINLLNMRSLCLYQLEELEEAEKTIIKALKIQPKDENLLLVGAKIAHKSGNTKLGKERVESLLKLNPKYKDVLDEDLKELLK